MIHISFEGGLGNQMFQYAYGRNMQEKFKENVVYDISKYDFESIEIREFMLKDFNINPNWKQRPLKKSRLERYGLSYMLYLGVTFIYININKLFNNKKNTIGNNVYQKITNFFGYYRCHSEKFIDSKKSIFKTKYIRGQWINPKLFEDISDKIRKELRVITPISNGNQKILDKINSCNSVAIHIRRGDYVKLNMIVCDIPYYKRCMDKMSSMVDEPVFFIFSDDIQWVQENLDTKYNVEYVNNNNTSSEDMRLLYSCKHFILSNSTFSWWGAWLGNFKDKKVIVPKKWSKQSNEKSLLNCEEWYEEDIF